MSEIDEKLAASKKHIAGVQRQANDLKHAAEFRPSIVSDEDVSLAERLLASWKTPSQLVFKPSRVSRTRS